jgi:hypothetical protein
MKIRCCWVLFVAMASSGCLPSMDHFLWSKEPSLKPPPQPEQYALPPRDDPRFTLPIEYPKGTLNQDLIKKPSSSAEGPARFGAGGMGGTGMSGGGY